MVSPYMTYQSGHCGGRDGFSLRFTQEEGSIRYEVLFLHLKSTKSEGKGQGSASIEEDEES